MGLPSGYRLPWQGARNPPRRIRTRGDRPTRGRGLRRCGGDAEARKDLSETAAGGARLGLVERLPKLDVRRHTGVLGLLLAGFLHVDSLRRPSTIAARPFFRYWRTRLPAARKPRP